MSPEEHHARSAARMLGIEIKAYRPKRGESLVDVQPLTILMLAPAGHFFCVSERYGCMTLKLGSWSLAIQAATKLRSRNDPAYRHVPIPMRYD